MAQFVNDTFTETSDTALEAHTGETGAAWSLHPSYSSLLRVAASVDQCTCKTTGTGATAYYTSGTPASNEYDVEGDISYEATTSDELYIGLTGRMNTSADTMYMGRHNRDTNVWELYKAVTGTFTLLGSYSQTLTTSQVYATKLEIRSAAKKLFIDSVERISSADDVITATDKAGVRFNVQATNASNGRLDNYTATDAAGGAAAVVSGSHSLLGVGI